MGHNWFTKKCAQRHYSQNIRETGGWRYWFWREQKTQIINNTGWHKVLRSCKRYTERVQWFGLFINIFIVLHHLSALWLCSCLLRRLYFVKAVINLCFSLLSFVIKTCSDLSKTWYLKYLSFKPCVLYFSPLFSKWCLKICLLFIYLFIWAITT